MISSAAFAERPRVVAYVPNWVNTEQLSTRIDYGKITHINPIDDDGTLSFHKSNEVLIAEANRHSVKVLVSIGGGLASSDLVLKARYLRLLAAPRRKHFVRMISEYLVEHRFDGLDVDIEGDSITDDFGPLIDDLAIQLKPQGKLLTAAFSHGYGGRNVPETSLAHFDFVNVMAYDAAGPWNPNEPGQHASIDFAKSSVQYWLDRGLPTSKVILGLPFYGYGFGEAFWPSGYGYANIVAKYPGAEFADQAGKTIWYNGIETIREKSRYAVREHLGGVMIWSLDNDATGEQSLLRVIDQALRPSD
jgi:GH18 family chitinase